MAKGKITDGYENERENTGKRGGKGDNNGCPTSKGGYDTKAGSPGMKTGGKTGAIANYNTTDGSVGIGANGDKRQDPRKSSAVQAHHWPKHPRGA